ncbi:MAG: hypothetical protein MR291_04045 [Oscillospiraceae bacterium]|nr:hypothetical protein [Oscillospiraceae bacterium]
MINEDNNSQPELDIELGNTADGAAQLSSPPEIPETVPPVRTKKPGVLISDWFLMLALYIITLVIHVLMTQVTTMFNLTPDEYAVTGVAAWANGYDWSATVSAGGYYGYFQSLFYIPVFSLVEDPMTRYHVMILINGFIMSFVPVIAYYLSRNWFGVRKLSSVFIAVICGMYPSYLLLTKYTWNETMCCILPWVFALLMFLSLKSHKDTSHSFRAVFMQQLWAVLAGFVLIAAYASHGRMLALTAAGMVLELVVLIGMKKRLFSVIGFFSGTVGFFIIDSFVKKFIQAGLWLSETKTKASVNTIENMFGRIAGIDGEKLAHFPQTLFGHFFYFISSTWGFGAICIVLIISGIVMYHVTAKRAKASGADSSGKVQTYISSGLAVFCWFALLCMGAIFVVSVMFKATSTVYDTRADTAIFGRYIETFFPIAIFPALVMIYRRRFTARHCFAALLTGAFLCVMTEMFTVSAVVGDGETTKSIVGAMILGIGPLRIGEGLKDPFTDMTFIKIIGVVMLLLLAVVILRLIKKKEESMFNFIAIPLGALLIYSTLYGFDNYTISQGKNASYGSKYVTEALSMIEDCPYNDVLCFSMKGERYSKAQFLFPDMHIRLASSTKKLQELETCPDFIISGRENNLNMWLDDVYLVGDINHNVQLYACSNEAISWARAEGLTLTEPGALQYTGGNIPGTNSVSRNDDSAMLPEGSAVYTNYFTLYNKGSYTACVKGANISELNIALTSDKKSKDIPYEITERAADSIVLKFSISAKTENVQLKLTNKNGGEAVSVNSLSVEMSSYLVKEYDGDSLHKDNGALLNGTSVELPGSAAVRTSDLIIREPGDLAFRVRGSGLEQLTVSLTANGEELPFEIDTDNNEYIINFTLPKATGDLRLTLTNSSAETCYVDSVGYIRRSAQKIATLPKTAGVSVVIS